MRGKPTLDDFRLEEAEIPAPGPGQVLLSVRYLSLDPYMRGRMDDRKSYAPPAQIGDVMPGETVAEVVASNNPLYSIGDIVTAYTGWCSLALSEGRGLRKLDPRLAPVTRATEFLISMACFLSMLIATSAPIQQTH